MVTCLFSSVISTTTRHGRSTTPRLPHIAVAASARRGSAPAPRSRWKMTEPAASTKIPEAPLYAVGNADPATTTQVSSHTGSFHGISTSIAVRAIRVSDSIIPAQTYRATPMYTVGVSTNLWR